MREIFEKLLTVLLPTVPPICYGRMLERQAAMKQQELSNTSVSYGRKPPTPQDVEYTYFLSVLLDSL
ncbi:unnamed protein product [Cylicocyclus nassatus]|uniref:Uncharacterized protein n=1 Tax=Cylicocyclus nassatus TaxID=53992 RepID=A0AA36DRI2_CYLNA|nr:unnamed protein product [Cylicocyclus nassatus]